MSNKIVETSSPEDTTILGQKIGQNLRGGEVIELISDLGGGKTTLVKGLARGFGSNYPVSSPTFTISNVYGRSDAKQIHHFDFYRLDEAGIVADELAEVVGDNDRVVVVEWGNIIHDVLPKARLLVRINASGEETRTIELVYPEKLEYLVTSL